MNRFETVSGLTGSDETKTLAESGDRTVWGRHIVFEGKYTQTYLEVRIRGYGTVCIDTQVNTDGSSRRGIEIGAIPSGNAGIDYYNWSTLNLGRISNAGSSGFGSAPHTEFFAGLKEEGFTAIDRLSDLPNQINVDQAVTYWLGQIETAIKSPKTLSTMDFSVASLIGSLSL